jgi:hypothetical protein
LNGLLTNLFRFFQQGQTALSIAEKLGYISVVETLKVVTETIVTTTTTTVTEEKFKVVVPESMQEAFISDSEDEAGKKKPFFNYRWNSFFHFKPFTTEILRNINLLNYFNVSSDGKEKLGFFACEN